MAYGSKNNRKKILDSIVEGADGGSIMEGIEYAIQSEDNRSRGRGAASAAKSLEDTYQNVSSMKRSLGAKQQATNEAITERRSSDSKSSIAKDWMTILTGQAEADKPDNDIKFSEQLASRMASPQTVDDKFLVTGKPPPKIDSSSAPYVPSDNPDDAPITYSGDQEAGASGRTAAIDAALQEAIEGEEPAGLMTRPKARPERLDKDEPSESAPINVRNNNLGNIKNLSSNNWKGQTNLKTKETFASFSSPELGVRALKKVIQANINATSTIEEYVNRYASEPDEKAHFKKTGSLLPHLRNYALVIAKSQGLDSEKAKLPKKANMLEWIKATAKAEGGAGALSYFTDDVIKAGIKL